MRVKIMMSKFKWFGKSFFFPLCFFIYKISKGSLSVSLYLLLSPSAFLRRNTQDSLVCHVIVTTLTPDRWKHRATIKMLTLLWRRKNHKQIGMQSRLMWQHHWAEKWVPQASVCIWPLTRTICLGVANLCVGTLKVLSWHNVLKRKPALKPQQNSGKSTRLTITLSLWCWSILFHFCSATLKLWSTTIPIYKWKTGAERLRDLSRSLSW
jgi:hypothetical protein